MTMEYKGYLAGVVDFDSDGRVFSGTVAGMRDVIHFEGATAEDARASFRDGIDEYLALCAERGEEPDSPHER